MSQPRGATKDLSLEAVRGVAALAVFAWHFFYAFHPTFLFSATSPLSGSPLFAFFHGTAAVDLFFLLSGYVLTRRYFEAGDNRLLVRGAGKRWFRLMPIALISIMMSWACYHFGWYRSLDAAVITQSRWLSLNGGALYPPINPTFAEAFHQGTVGVFLGVANYNSNLWTLQIELFGSFLAFAFAWGVFKIRASKLAVAALSLMMIVASFLIDRHYVMFIVGPLLALTAPACRKISLMTGVMLIIGGIILLGYRAPVGFYGFMETLSFLSPDTLYSVLSLVGSSMLIMACSCCAPINGRMQNGFARFLGRISFPLYAIHIVMICSLGSAIFVALAPSDHQGAVQVTAIVLVPTVLFLATVLAVFDAWWVRLVNRKALELESKLSSYTGAQQIVNV